jgi:hypothetical protein
MQLPQSLTCGAVVSVSSLSPDCEQAANHTSRRIAVEGRGRVSREAPDPGFEDALESSREESANLAARDPNPNPYFSAWETRLCGPSILRKRTPLQTRCHP